MRNEESRHKEMRNEESRHEEMRNTKSERQSPGRTLFSSHGLIFSITGITPIIFGCTLIASTSKIAIMCNYMK